MVFENAMGIIEVGEKSELLQIGEMVRVGDVWKLTQIPQPLEGDSVEVTLGGILMQPNLGTPDAPALPEGLSVELQKLLKELQVLDERSPSPNDGATALVDYNVKRADLLEKLIEIAPTDDDRDLWTRQVAAGIAAAVQTGGYEDGLPRLKKILEAVTKRSPESATVAYVTYRIMLAEYGIAMRQAKSEDHEQLQEKWLKDLEEFATKFPSAEDTPESLLQLAIAEEFAGRMKEARKWYDTLSEKHAATPAGTRAAGAIRRLKLEGEAFNFSASGFKGGTISNANFRGKVLLVLFWSTWCKPCTEDLPQLRALYDRYRGNGFEVLGVNLDVAKEPVAGYVAEHKVPWPQVYEPGGLDSPPALKFGIISLPTMFLIGPDGKVLSRSTSVDDLKVKLPELFEKKKPEKKADLTSKKR
jgi:thiol-disulfide isomerase/thioredoxin